MPSAALLEQLVADSEERVFPELTPRNIEVPLLPGKANVIVGMRRVGKTSLAFSLLGRRLEQGAPRESLLYINFEDERLWDMEARHLSEVLEVFYRRTPANRARPCTLVLDEIQNVPGWERFVRRVLDSENAHVLITGSSAKLLSREVATSLGGRGLTSELFPFDFSEALLHGEGITVNERPGKQLRSRIEANFDRYLERGGFPEVQGMEEPLRRRILQDYLQVALLRDIIERHALTSVTALRAMSRQLLANPAGLFSINKLHGDLKSRGIPVGKNTLHEFLDHFEDAYLFFVVPIFTHSERVRQSNPRKIYPIDAGLVTACAGQTGYGLGQLLETLVFLHLRRRGARPSYYRHEDGTEVDFVCERAGKVELVQVSADVTSSDTRQRELRALQSAMRELDSKEATIVTLRHEERLQVPEGTIHMVPAWWWCTR